MWVSVRFLKTSVTDLKLCEPLCYVTLKTLSGYNKVIVMTIITWSNRKVFSCLGYIKA